MHVLEFLKVEFIWSIVDAYYTIKMAVVLPLQTVYTLISCGVTDMRFDWVFKH